MERKPRLVPNHTVIDGINAARQTINSCWFDAARCSRGLDCLRSYAVEWDEHARTFRKTPAHNWASHAADSFRYLAMSWREPIQAEEQPNPVKELLKPRTWNDVWESYADERLDGGDEYDETVHGAFNLNETNDNNLEFK